MTKKTLYHQGKQGETRVWSIWTEGTSIKTEYGVLDGELQVAVKKATPKNVGRSNETTGEQQAELEAEAKYQFNLTRKYFLTVEETKTGLRLPMLAKEIEERKVKFPCFVQPKLDGVRCLAFWENNEIKLISRAGKEWTVPKHIKEQLEELLYPDCMVDGELYIHGKSFQTISSYVKKWRDVETPTVEYHIYDCPIAQNKDGAWVEGLSFSERLESIEELKIKLENLQEDENLPLQNIIFVETKTVSSMKEIKDYESQCVANGYEGAIVRNLDGKYIFGYRSDDLLKVKTFQDAEFVVLSIRDGIGKYEGCAVFTCQNDLNDLTFECTIMGTMEERAEMFKNQKKYIGKKLTVKFFERTDDNLPRMPVGKAFRDPKDLPT